MGETLRDRALKNYEVAKKLFDCRMLDEIYLNDSGYKLQQSFELYLKHLLEINSIKYPCTHDISILIDILSKEHITIHDDVDIVDKLEMLAGTITTWESKTRYIKNFRVTEKELLHGFRLITKLLNIDGSDDIVSTTDKLKEAAKILLETMDVYSVSKIIPLPPTVLETIKATTVNDIKNLNIV